MQKLKTFDDVLALWEKPKALSDDLRVPYVNAQAMKNRGSIGVDHWPRLIELLAEKGYTVTTDDLLKMRQTKGRRAHSDQASAA